MSIVSGSLQAWSTAEAASTQASAADRATQAELEMYKQAREDLAPWREAGGWATQELVNKIALGPGGKTSAPVNALVPTKGITPSTQQRTEQAAQPSGFRLPDNAFVGPGQYGQTYVPEGHWGIPTEMGEGTWGVSEIQPIPAGAVTAQGTPVGYYPGSQGGQGQPAEPGQNALSTIQLPGATSDYSEWPSQYQQSPYYNFLLGEGTKALERGAAARGKQFSGAQGKALTSFGQNLGLTDYDNWLKNWYNSLTPYQSLAGLGQTSGVATGNAAMQTGANVAQNTLAAGNAVASGQLGMGNIASRTASNLSQNALNYYYGNQGSGWGGSPTNSGYGAYGDSAAGYAGYNYGAGEGAGGMDAYEWASMMGY